MTQNPYGYPGGYPETAPPGGIIPPGGIATAGFLPPGPSMQGMRYYYYIMSKMNNMVLDVEGDGRHPMSKVILWHKKDVFADNQLWYDDYQTGTIKSKISDLCLDLEGNQLVVNTYQPGNNNQLWEGVTCVIRNRMNALQVLEIAGGNGDPGANASAGVYTGAPYQMFEPIFPPPPGINVNVPGGVPTGVIMPNATDGSQNPNIAQGGGYNIPPQVPQVQQIVTPIKKEFFIVSELNGKVIDIRGNNPKEGAQVIIYSKQPGNQKNQLWYFDERGILKSSLNNFVPQATGKNTQLIMVPYRGGPAQEFRLDGKKLVNGANECVDIRGASNSDAAEIITYEYKKGSNQHWILSYV